VRRAERATRRQPGDQAFPFRRSAPRGEPPQGLACLVM
jgi:hypothetical protein